MVFRHFEPLMNVAKHISRVICLASFLKQHFLVHFALFDFEFFAFFVNFK